MSYILDALRKSEHERQLASGQKVSMLYPIEIERNSNPWLLPALIAVLVFIGLAVIWWTGSPHESPKPVEITGSTPQVAVAPQPPALPVEKFAGTTSQHVKPDPATRHDKPVPESVQIKKHDSSLTETPKIQPTQAEEKPTPALPQPTSKTASADPLKGMPEINITGYVHNELSGSMAMINNQLVHEGEEISPGLRLVKVLDNSAVLSYKGYAFTR